jgi:NAD(P)-dependent dehydrogenase (short-subunit alcohol dehydrogenase family)
MTMKKVVLITGVSSGIGKETAKLLAQKGFTVYGASRRLDKMEDLKAFGIHLLELDLTEDESIERCINNIIAKEARMDIIVNNAGYGAYGALEDLDLSEARKQFEVNVFGLARVIQLALPHMRKNKSGRIINVSSIGGSFGEPHGSWYHSTKYALEGLSDSLRMELQQFGIAVVIIKPGAIKTEWSKIARENLLKVSGNTAYKNLAEKHYKMLENADKRGSEPMVIAETILQASTVAKPKTRYVVGSGAKPAMFLSRILSDRWFDKVMLSMMK